MTTTARKKGGGFGRGHGDTSATGQAHGRWRRASTTIQVPSTSCTTLRTTSSYRSRTRIAASAVRTRQAAGRSSPESSRQGPRWGGSGCGRPTRVSRYWRRTTRVTARITIGESRHAGHDRLAATPNGMWCASWRTASPSGPGRTGRRGRPALEGLVVEAAAPSRRAGSRGRDRDVGGGDPVGDAEERIQRAASRRSPGRARRRRASSHAPVLQDLRVLARGPSAGAAMASDICTTAVLKKVPCR